MHVVAAIFARGGSKGIPRKNLQLVGGKPLIVHAIEVALTAPSVSEVVVSTDDSEIADVARAAGAAVPFMRPADLSTDEAPEWLAWQHLIRSLDGRRGAAAMDIFLCVPPTSPLRAVDDLERCVDLISVSDADVVVTVRPSERSPYFNMVKLDSAGYASLVIKGDQPLHQRQAAPAVFDITTVAYAARPAFVLAASSLFDGRVRAVTVPAERALDIDTPMDLRIARCLFMEDRR